MTFSPLWDVLGQELAQGLGLRHGLRGGIEREKDVVRQERSPAGDVGRTQSQGSGRI